MREIYLITYYINYSSFIGNFGLYGPQSFSGYGPQIGKKYGALLGHGNPLEMFNRGYPKGGVGGYINNEILNGYPKGGLGGYKKDGIEGYQKGLNVGYLQEMMQSGLYPGFDGINSFASEFGLNFEGLGGYPKLGSGGFGQFGWLFV